MTSSWLNIFERPHADLPSKDWPLLSSPWSPIFIILTYLLLVLKLGPYLMKDRKPYNVKNLIIAYNIMQVVYNGIIFGFSLWYIIIRPQFNLKCMMPLPMDHPFKYIERYFSYAYYINKLLDLTDTIFFILRKSNKQITFLHVYHHTLMFLGVYWYIRFVGVGGQYTLTGFINTFVHTVMYFYYFVAAMYPNLKGKETFKKCITKIQLAQFILVLIQAFYVLTFQPNCPVPNLLIFLQISQAITMIVMFGNFYVNTYNKPKQVQKAE